jgi:hypothetical protein
MAMSSELAKERAMVRTGYGGEERAGREWGWAPAKERFESASYVLVQG